jgi:hypothetical protein
MGKSYYPKTHLALKKKKGRAEAHSFCSFGKPISSITKAFLPSPPILNICGHMKAQILEMFQLSEETKVFTLVGSFRLMNNTPDE